MLSTQEDQAIRELNSQADFDDARDESVGYIFHGNAAKRRRTVGKNTNLLHFARCNKLEKMAADQPHKVWFGTIRVAREHLNESVGQEGWKWCKQCESEVTQKLLESEGF